MIRRTIERGMEMDEYIKKETAYRAIMGERPEARAPAGDSGGGCCTGTAWKMVIMG